MKTLLGRKNCDNIIYRYGEFTDFVRVASIVPISKTV
jgi:hypothetical protein